MKTLRFIGFNLLIPLPFYLLWIVFAIGDSLPRHSWMMFPLGITSIFAIAGSAALSLFLIDKAYDTRILQS